MTTDSISNYRVTRGYTTSAGDGDSESVAFFATRREAIAAARAEVCTLRVTNRNGLIITDEVMVDELDSDGEPIDQPIFWVQADQVVAVPARLTYRYSPASLADGAISENCWYTVYDRRGRVIVETTDEDVANQAASKFDEIVEAELEAAS